jgi:hypothetical protein
MIDSKPQVSIKADADVGADVDDSDLPVLEEDYAVAQRLGISSKRQLKYIIFDNILLDAKLAENANSKSLKTKLMFGIRYDGVEQMYLLRCAADELQEQLEQAKKASKLASKQAAQQKNKTKVVFDIRNL